MAKRSKHPFREQTLDDQISHALSWLVNVHMEEKIDPENFVLTWKPAEQEELEVEDEDFDDSFFEAVAIGLHNAFHPDNPVPPTT